MYIYSLLHLGEALERERAPGPQLRLLDAVRARQARARDEGAHRADALGDGLGARRPRCAGLAERELVEATLETNEQALRNFRKALSPRSIIKETRLRFSRVSMVCICWISGGYDASARRQTAR